MPRIRKTRPTQPPTSAQQQTVMDKAAGAAFRSLLADLGALLPVRRARDVSIELAARYPNFDDQSIAALVDTANALYIDIWELHQ